MKEDSNGNERSAYSVLKSEILLLLFAALISIIISISFSFYLDFLKTYDRTKNLNTTLYLEIIRNNFAMWELMSNISEGTKDNIENRLYYCYPYDTHAYKFHFENSTSLPSEIDYSLNEFYSLLFRLNYICELVMHDSKMLKPLQIELKNDYLNLLQSAMNIGGNLMRKLEFLLKIPQNYNQKYNTRMKNLRKKVFYLHPELKEKLGKPIFVYDENNNRMMLKEYE